jgi:predicted nucleotide-binding protein
MKELFEKEPKRLRAALRDQAVLGCDSSLIEEVAKAVHIEEFQEGSILTNQGAEESDVFFLLMGTGVEILIDGTPVAARNPGEIVGEMAAIEPAPVRSATIRAGAGRPTVVARLDGARFSELCDQYPGHLYRGIARVVAARLRERSKHIRPRAARPTVFVGSSVEGLELADALRNGLDHCGATIDLWSDVGSVFKPSSTAVEDLTAALNKYDFAVFILSPDDTLRLGGAHRDQSEQRAARDNVIFEFGLFKGALGRDRAFGVMPRGVNMRRPTDLGGVTMLEYEYGNPSLPAALGPACSQLRALIKDKGPR